MKESRQLGRTHRLATPPLVAYKPGCMAFKKSVCLRFTSGFTSFQAIISKRTHRYQSGHMLNYSQPASDLYL